MLSRSTVILLGLAFLITITGAQLNSVFPTPSQQCEFSIRVDPAKGNNWLEEYTQYLDQSIDRDAQDQTLNLTCNDLQEALIAISNTVFHKSNSCIEVVISKGTHNITESVEIAQNVHIHGEQVGEVFVDFNATVKATQNKAFFSILTFLNADHVEISDIEFSNSPGIIAVENVTLVKVSDSSFRWFSRGALDIYQCFIVNVTNCVFEDNGFVGVTKFGYQYRGHAGGLSVGFDDDHYSSNGTDPDSVPDVRGLQISGCKFRNNTSNPQESGKVVTTSQLISDFIFSGRGGALAIIINSSFAFDMRIEDCVVENNFATSFGGGIYLGYSGYNTHTTDINRILFTNNNCDGPSGGLHSAFIEGGGNGFTVTLNVYNSEFYDNEAEFGGAIFLFSNRSAVEGGVVKLNNAAHFENCTFMRNSATEYGAAISLASLLFLVDSSNVQPLSITDCTFIDNNGGRAGVLSTAYLPLAFYGQNKFYRNRGRVLVISGTHADINGHMHFKSTDGSAVDAGALYVTSFGHLQLNNGARMVFENNTGILGASIVVVSIASLSESYSNLLYNPLCVLRSENSTDSPQDWQNVNIKFTGNKALFGSTVLLNDVNLCSWTSLGPVFFNNSEVFRWNFIDFSEDNINKAHSPDQTNPLWYVQTPAKEIFLTGTNNVTAYPGEFFSLNVTGIDQLGLTTPVAIYFTDGQEGYVFNPSAAAPGLIQMPSINTTLTTSRHTVEDVRDTKPTNISVSTIFTQSSLSLSFTFTPEICPAGHVLEHKDDGTELQHFCNCNEENNPQIYACKEERILLKEGQWGIQSDLTGAKDRLVTYSCPPQYCQCFGFSKTGFVTCNFIFDFERPDIQCQCSRKGELCGDCSDDTAGFTALLDRCETCGYVNGLLIVALLVVDAIVIGLLLLVKSSPFNWLYPAIFHLQAVPYLALHFPVTFKIVHPYVYYVSSALSFYFVYDFCLGPQLSALSAYFIRFIPFLVSIAVTIPVIVFRFRYRLNNRPWPGLWWVVLFQYTHVVYTCVSILNCPMLPGDDGLISPRWYVNGNITCFTGFHIPLALFALVVLLFCVSIIPIILLYSLGYLERPGWILNSVLPATSTFKPNLSWWCAVELTRRLLLVIFIIAIPRNDYPAMFFLMITMGVYVFVKPFKERSANIIEAFLAVGVVVLLLFRQTSKTFEFIYSPPGLVTDSDISQYREGCYENNTVYEISVQTILLTPLYYIPLAFVILASCASAIINIRSYYWRRRRSSSADVPDDSDGHRDQNQYHRVDSRRHTMSIEISDQHHDDIPLSRIMGRINGRERNTDKRSGTIKKVYQRWKSSGIARTLPRTQVSNEDIALRYRSPTISGSMRNIQESRENLISKTYEKPV